MSLPTLVLTSFIKESEQPGVFIGRINEISGIFAQGNSREEVYDDLVGNTAIMRRYKEDEFVAVLRKQLAERYKELLDSRTPPQFHLVINEVQSEVNELEAA